MKYVIFYDFAEGCVLLIVVFTRAPTVNELNPQKFLNIVAARKPGQECLVGSLGYTVNMIHLNEDLFKILILGNGFLDFYFMHYLATSKFLILQTICGKHETMSCALMFLWMMNSSRKRINTSSSHGLFSVFFNTRRVCTRVVIKFIYAKSISRYIDMSCYKLI